MRPQKLIISSMATGYETDVPPFDLNNDAFPTLENAYIWRKRLKKKRGATQIGRLQRTITAKSLGNTTNPGGSLTVNILTFGTSLGANASVVPSTVTITIGGQSFVEASPPDGTLNNGGGGGTGSINYASGAVVLQTAPVLANTAATVTFNYYPDLPVMGIEEFLETLTSADVINFPTTVYFDTTYAYEYNYTTKKFFDVSFYKMNTASPNPVVWSGQNYQQFWSWSYQNAMFVTNNKPGFNFKVITGISVAGAAVITIANHGLVVQDNIFINEVAGMVEINGLTGTVTGIVDVNNVTVNINSSGFSAYTSGGIAQYLSNTSTAGQDGIRWYDGNGLNLGFANFAPPLQLYSSSILHPTYLVGCKMLIPYQGQFIAIGTFEQASNGSPLYFPNRVRFSQNGTVFYANAPNNQSVDSTAWIDNIPGKGGAITLDTTERILTARVTQEVLVLGLEQTQRKIIGTNNNLDPFIIQIINPEFGSESTYASVALDTGIVTVGDYGFGFTSSYNVQRVDLKIPDQIFQIRNLNNGSDRVCGQRDYRNEFIYFTYPLFDALDVFPVRTLLYNYREGNFAVFREQYTTYGSFRENSSETWASLTTTTWVGKTTSWASGQNAAFYPNVAGGNAQGFVMKKNDVTENDPSNYIQAISSHTITSPNHCREVDDFILIENCIGSTNLNGSIFKVIAVLNTSQFIIDGAAATGTYLGLGVFRVMDNMNVLTKIFPFFWEGAVGTRLGTQHFLLDTTTTGEITVDVYASQNSDVPSNDPSIATYLPAGNVVRTRPDDSLGLNDAALQQAQIWHRLSNSFTGDSVQLGFRYSDAQMKVKSVVEADVQLYTIVMDYYPSRVLP